MKNLYSKANQAKVDAFLNDPEFRAIVEKDLGLRIKVKVIWEKGIIRIQGLRSGKEVPIQDILDIQNLN